MTNLVELRAKAMMSLPELKDGCDSKSSRTKMWA
jgi:hypothetical protein